MSRTISVRRRSSLPGAGFDASGNPSQTKEQVVGRITVTNYVNQGENLSAADLGLTVIDNLQLTLSEGLAGNTTGRRSVVYSAASAQFYVMVDGGASGDDPVATTSDPVVYFLAEGDAVRRPELL